MAGAPKLLANAAPNRTERRLSMHVVFIVSSIFMGHIPAGLICVACRNWSLPPARRKGYSAKYVAVNSSGDCGALASDEAGAQCSIAVSDGVGLRGRLE